MPEGVVSVEFGAGVEGVGEDLGEEKYFTMSSGNHFVSNSERGKPDCLTIPNNVPIFNSSWFGTGTVVVVSPSFFCIMMWLPLRRASSKPCLVMILQTSRPERARSLGTFQSRNLSDFDRGSSGHDGHDIGFFL